MKSCPHDSIRLTPRIPTSEFWSMTRARFIAIGNSNIGQPGALSLPL
nr:hypothetical protein [Desulfosporosinus metallidurans]